jgi:hypothetical protein
MNTTNIIKLVACFAWAGLAMASATPADAIAVTAQTGAYAACANQNTIDPQYHCPYFDGGEIFYNEWTNYKQQIKFANAVCNSGNCATDTSLVFTDMVYPTGRKVVTSTGIFCGQKYVYELGSCAC